MVNANAKTPNNKRKSMGNNKTPQSPKVAKLNDSLQSPTKNKGNATPGKPNKTPNPKGNAQQNNVVKTPKANLQNGAKTPGKNQQPASNQKVKRSSESENENSPKKLKMFGGTSELQQKSPQIKKGQNQPQVKKEGKKQPQVKQEQKGQIQVKQEGQVKKRKGNFFHLKEKINSGDKTALTELEAKIKAFESRKELTKTAQRKLKLLLKFKRVITGEKPAAPPSASQNKKQKQKDVKVKKEGGSIKPTQPIKPNQQKQAQKVAKVTPVKKEDDDEDDDSDESESDYEVEAEVTPGKLIKSVNAEENDSEDEDESEEEEEESGEEDDEEGDDSDEDDDEEEEEEQQPIIQQKGGKKKGEEKKNEVKAKNLKLQAMRNQGQLAGSVKANQKRAARRSKKNAD